MPYQRLFTYAPRSDRSQLENFLTEALCDLLTRMMENDQDAFKRFMTDVLLRECTECATSIGSLNDFGSFAWISQYYINCQSGLGWVDLCLKSNNRIVLFVENKVNEGCFGQALRVWVSCAI